MKTKYLYNIAIVALTFSLFACEADKKSNLPATSANHARAYDYGNEAWFQVFYNHIDSLVDVVYQDEDLLSLVDDFSYEWNDPEDENYNKYNEHASYYADLADLAFLSNSYLELNSLIEQCMGNTIENLGGNQTSQIAYLYALIQSNGYTSNTPLYSFLNSIEINDYEIALLYVYCAFYTHVRKDNITHYLILNDGYAQYPYAFSHQDCPIYSSPLTIWRANISNMDYWINYTDSLPYRIKQYDLINDSCAFNDYESLIQYLTFEPSPGDLYITVLECQENWQRDIDEATEQYEKEIQNIINSQLTPKEKLAILMIATIQMKTKKYLADRNYELCKRTANNEN